MQQRPLGRSGLSIAPIMLGGNVFGWTADARASHAVLDAFVAAGFNASDTADVYSMWAPGHQGGESETVIGAWLAGRGRRDDVVIATKVGMWPKFPKLTKANITAACEDSLKRLRTDYIDLYQAHKDDAETPLDETMAALAALQKAGKVRAVGASNFDAVQLLAAAASAKTAGVQGFVAAQDEYSLLHRVHETGLFPAMETLGIGLVPYFPLSGGALSGKYRKDKAFPAGTRLTEESRFVKPHWETIEKLAAFAEAHGHTLLELAMGWLASKPLVASIITGATRPEQVEANAASVGWKLTAAEMAEVDRLAAG
jgi:aryl-alcohol dehydrogenase-like predicted oxidoreductase